ncbi:MAG: endonuclease domain-containing protein [Pseudolabrys sp.]
MTNERARQLRENQTDAEKKLWRSLHTFKARGFHFRRQVPIDSFIVDFACYSARLVIEIDGGQHNEREAAAKDSGETLICQAMDSAFCDSGTTKS